MDGHIQYIADAFSFVQYLQRLPVVAPALAAFAVHLYIRQEVHFDGAQACPFAYVAASAFYIE